MNFLLLEMSTNNSIKFMENIKYIVVSGDTLSGICKKIYGRVDDKILKQVMINNHITNPNKISVGQVLLLPSIKPVTPTNTNVQPTQPTVNPAILTNTSNFNNDILIKEFPETKYFQEEFPKDMIVLHFTVSHNWQSDYNTFLRNDHVATPFIVNKTGPKHIIKLFDEKFWAYHLGQAEFCNNRGNDKRSIGIEIVNIGPVWLKDGIWRDYYQRRDGKGSTPEQSIIKGEHRDAQGGVKFPDEQVIAVCNLVNFLCDKWNIPRRVPKDKMLFQLPALNNFKGITAHMMFRRSGKYEMGPAWPWEKIKELCRLEEVDIV